jgi:serine/threonine protein kinase
MNQDLFIGRTLDEKYRIEEWLGKGGMGAVYRAVNLRMEQPVAVKVMNPRLLDNREARQRFLQEARTAVMVQHPNAVSVTDFGETEDGLVYLVMEFLEGSSLRQIITAEAPLDVARAVSLMLQVAAAVGAAHEAGVIHRDLKPPNIFIEQRKDAPSSVRLLDFGIAKLLASAETDEDALHYVTGAGTLVGTPRYMSPEQCDGEPLTPASDVYSLGVMLYEMLAGATPFDGNAMELIIKHATESPRPLRELNPAVPESLEKLVLHSLAKNPVNRPGNAAEFRRELYETAERLGLEHADADIEAALARLQDEGHRSPSGRYVIDLEKLREHRAFETRQNREIRTEDVAGESNETAGGQEVAAPALLAESPALAGFSVYAPPPRRHAYLGAGVTFLALGIVAGGFAWRRAAIRSPAGSPPPGVSGKAATRGIGVSDTPETQLNPNTAAPAAPLEAPAQPEKPVAPVAETPKRPGNLAAHPNGKPSAPKTAAKSSTQKPESAKPAEPNFANKGNNPKPAAAKDANNTAPGAKIPAAGNQTQEANSAAQGATRPRRAQRP